MDCRKDLIAAVSLHSDSCYINLEAWKDNQDIKTCCNQSHWNCCQVVKFIKGSSVFHVAVLNI